MKATCPNDPTHNLFITTAHEMHEWVVDSEGDYMEDRGCLDITQDPDPDNIWTCKECGAEAKVRK